MYNTITRLSVFLVLISASLAVDLSAQPKGFIEIPQLRSISADHPGCYRENGVVDEMGVAKMRENPNCAEDLAKITINFERETLVHYTVASDCHMSVAIKVLRSDAEKQYKVIVDNLYGGCRAGGWRDGWIVFEKVRPGYTAEVIEVKVDERRSFSQEFFYPKPPSMVLREAVKMREVDLKNCLPLSGQSQWILSSAEFLANALNDGPDKQRCTEYFKTLNLDFRYDMLVGYSFSSGYCDRPPGLEMKAIKETSTDASENRLVLRFSYDDPKGYPCPIYKTYGLWVVVPHLDSGYRIDPEAKARKAETAPAPEKLAVREVDLKGCIRFYPEHQHLIRDKESYLKAIRNDAGRERCLKDVEPIDFEKYALFGIDIDSGYCNRPMGLNQILTMDAARKKYLLTIGWQDPRSSVCRAMSQYDLWLLVPKMPGDYGLDIEFDIK